MENYFKDCSDFGISLEEAKDIILELDEYFTFMYGEQGEKFKQLQLDCE